MKDHQLATCAANVTKEDFLTLLSNLWAISFLPHHLISGFVKCGLCPWRGVQFFLISSLKLNLTRSLLNQLKLNQLNEVNLN